MRRLIALPVVAVLSLVTGASITDARSAPAPSTPQLQRQVATMQAQVSALRAALTAEVNARTAQDEATEARVAPVECEVRRIVAPVPRPVCLGLNGR